MAQITLNSSGVASSGSLLLQTNGTTTQATVDTSGNLGLGVTPSAWISTFKALQVSSGAAFQGQTNSVSIAHVSGNAYVDSGGTYRYIGTGEAAQRYQQYQGAHSWYTAASGTAGNPISFTQAMTLDASGNLLVGTTTANSYGGYSTFQLGQSTSGGIINFQGGATSTSSAAHIRLDCSGTTVSSLVIETRNQAGTSSTPIVFKTQETERARIDTSGNLLVGTTSTGNSNSKSFVANIASGFIVVNHLNGQGSGSGYASFGYNASEIGSITQNGTTAVAYNTTSDYRLKENVQPLSGALARVAALKPCTYTWKSAPDEIGEGFIAHELAEICPQAVTGEKDAVNEDGSIKPQSIDTSFLVATLTAAIQEQQAIIETLTSRIAALENK